MQQCQGNECRVPCLTDLSGLIAPHTCSHRRCRRRCCRCAGCLWPAAGTLLARCCDPKMLVLSCAPCAVLAAGRNPSALADMWQSEVLQCLDVYV